MELSKTKLSRYAGLASRKLRERRGIFIVEGRKAVADTLHSFVPEALLVADGSSFPEPVSCPVYEVSESDMRRISNLTTPSDVAAIYRLPEPQADIKIDPSKLYLMLDGVQDPGNLGTIIRTCHWFGIFTILASKGTADVFNPKTLQATMGSVGHVEVVYCDLENIIAENPGMPVWGTLLEGNDIFREKLEPRGFLVMGNEGNGISDAIRALITHPLNIPPATPDHGESLNVSIATAVALAQFVK